MSAESQISKVTHPKSVAAIYAQMDWIKTGVAIFGQDLTLLFANKTIRSYLPVLYSALDSGISLKDGIARQVVEHSPDSSVEDRAKRVEYIYDTILNSGTMEVSTSNGRRIKSTYDKTPDGTYVITTSDVTDPFRNEKMLAKAKIDADAANKTKTEFLANMSHEIRTPLSGVFMAAQLLQQQLRMTQQTQLSDLADILVSSSQHLSAIINDVLDMSKIEAGQVEIATSETSLRDMLQDIKKAQTPIANEISLKMELVLDPNLPERFMIDSSRVRQCVSNLVSNALKFTKTGTVTIAALFNVETYMVTIHVVDTGVGISPDEQNDVFDQFAQAKKDPSSTHMGTGLGLTISRNLARLMDGDLTLKSELGKGSIFSLTFKSEPVVADTTLSSEAA